MIERKEVILTIILLVLIPVPSHGQSAVSSSTGVVSVALAQIIDFSVLPAFTSQNQFIDFSITVKNVGNLQFNASAVINITNSSNYTISNLTFTNVSIAVGNDATFIASWNTNGYPLGDYNATAVVDYDGKSTPPEETTFKIQAVAPPPTRRGGGPPATEPPPEELYPPPPLFNPPGEQSLGEGRIRFVKYPVIKEMRPGETATANILVSNVGAANISQFTVDIEGIPKEWVEVMTEDSDIKARDIIGINMGFSVPGGVFPGNYRVTVILRSGDSESKIFFILRIKPLSVELERPSVTRSVVVDERKSSSEIILKIENTGRFIQRLEIVEDIPKDLASHVGEVEFEVSPSEILEADPIVKWTLENIDFFETRIISYNVSKILKDFTTYVNWPIKQVNIQYQISSPLDDMEISNVDLKTLYIGKEENVAVTVSNLGVIPHLATLSVTTLSGWEVNPKKVTEQFAPGSKKVFNFTIIVPENTTIGIQNLFLKLDYNEKIIRKDVTLFVNNPPIEIPKQFKLAFFIVILFSLAWFFRLRKKKKKSINKID